jgi:hypothetical protein
MPPRASYRRVWERFWSNLAGRVEGPLDFRLIMQPMMAAFLAIRDGLRDARSGRPYFLEALRDDPAHRAERIRDAWHSIGRIVIFALVLDAIYQFIEFRWLYPGEAMVVAVVVAVVPYLLIRGVANRVARWWTGHHPTLPAPRPR